MSEEYIVIDKEGRRACALDYAGDDSLSDKRGWAGTVEKYSSRFAVKPS